MDCTSQNMEWFSITHNSQTPPHLTCKHVCLSLLEMHLTEARFASCFVMWKQMQSSALCPCLSVLSRVCHYKRHICFIKAVRELNRCDSNLLASNQRCILTNPSGPVSTPQPAGGVPVWLPIEKTRHYCSFFPLISLITFANQINPSGSLWRAASCNLKGPPSNLHLIRCKCVTSVSNQ